MLFVHFTEPAPGRDQQVEDFFRRSLIAFQNRILGFLVAILHRERSHAQLRTEIAQPAVTAFTCGKSRMAIASSYVSSLRVRISSVGRPKVKGSM